MLQKIGIACLCLLAGLAPAEEGFTPLFNGKNLDGWMLATNCYAVDPVAKTLFPIQGKRAPDSRSYIYTKELFTNFVLRFEFKLTKGANNGIGVRCPDEGFASFDGMEIQILDDTHYPEIDAAHHHGALYGVTNTSDAPLKPVGEWNEEEISEDGAHLRITVNGQVTADFNLDKVVPLDSKYVGYKRRWGRLGLLGGEDTLVTFRNIRVKRLP